MKLHLPAVALPVLLASLVLAPAAASARTIRVQSTTDTQDAGLVDDLLKPAWNAANPNDPLDYFPTGTGKALDNARTGIADVVITHAPALEQRFVDDGFSLEPFGHAIFFSDYVIVAPAGDPAGVLAAAPHDAVSAFEKIAAAGDAGRATFVSRGDNSGTNSQEEIIWGLTDVPKHVAANASGDASRFEPWTGTGYPAWYKQTSKGQAPNLLDTSVCAPASYPNGNCYTILDRGTFNRAVNRQTVTNLHVVSQRNAAGARGGENLLVNPFSAYVVNPAKFADQSRFDVPSAQRFVDFLTSPAFQAAVDAYPSASDPAFHSDATPAITLTTALPQVANAGRSVWIDLVATNKLPGGGAIAGLPVQLQASTDNGRSYVDVGTPVSTDASGRASLRPVLAASTRYAVTVPRYRQFTGGVTELGLVAAIPAAVAAPAKDGVAPVVGRPALTTRKLTLTLSEAGKVKVTVKRRVTRTTTKGGRKKTSTVYRTVKSFTITATKAGTYSRTFKRIAAGRYRVTLAATDAAGNATASTRAFTVRATTSKAKAS